MSKRSAKLKVASGLLLSPAIVPEPIRRLSLNIENAGKKTTGLIKPENYFGGRLLTSDGDTGELPSGESIGMIGTETFFEIFAG